MKNPSLIIVVMIFVSLQSFSQIEKIKAFSIIDVGTEFQVYPTGVIYGARVETNISNKDALKFMLGGNSFDHKDFPKQAGINDHISEIGDGLGFSLGYKHYFWRNVKNLFVGFNTDVWFSSVNWDRGHKLMGCYGSTPATGVSNIVVIQPTIEAGWLFEIGKRKNLILTPKIAFGYEWNMITSGEQTGFGMILLGGLSASYRFNKNINELIK